MTQPSRHQPAEPHPASRLEIQYLPLIFTVTSAQSVHRPVFRDMANPILNSVQMLPHFLLPRLSWQTAPLHHNTIRSLSMLSSAQRDPSSWRNDPAPSKSLIRNKQHEGTRRLKSSILHDYHHAHHRSFHATARQWRDHHFDTLKFVQRLQEEGFTEAQSVAMMKVLSDVIEERFVL